MKTTTIFAAQLKTYTVLDKKETQNLPVISQEYFCAVVDMLYREPHPDYRHIPNIIRLPPIRKELAAVLGVESDNFFLKPNLTHVRPQRKARYSQNLRIEEMKGLLDFIRNAEKDCIGNYVVTIAKIDTSDLCAEHYKKVGAGVAPAIRRLQE